MRRAIAFMTVFVAVAFISASATIINVPDDYPTIQQGIDASTDGDTVLVAPGNYSGEGNRDISTGGKAITVLSEQGAENTIIDCEEAYNGFNIDNLEDFNTVISGFSIENCVIGILCDRSSPVIDGCVISNFSNSGIYIDGADPNILTAPVVQDCLISQTDLSLQGTGKGIYIYRYVDVTITGCTIDECEYGIEAGNASAVDDTNFDITHCDITNNASHGIWLNPYGWFPGGMTPNGPINYCNFEGNGGYDLYASSCSNPEVVINAENVYWVATDSATIADNHIYDHLDNNLSPTVDFIPFLLGEYPQDIPTLSEWGMLIMALLLLAVGTVAVVRRKKTALGKAT